MGGRVPADPPIPGRQRRRPDGRCPARELAVVDRAVFVRSDRGRIDVAVEQIANLLP
ncbi:hypothetical protein [Nocardioides sp. B-3]|uniref:hypothetical protein n=1 Tax=Nocardioides sp. B-3 TaxID=2895565 RepID=UPI003FA5E61E